MQTRYTALENRSKDLLISQSTAVSGASVALSGLGNRLEHLVEQLITSYNISEQDLEVSFIFILTFNVTSKLRGIFFFLSKTYLIYHHIVWILIVMYLYILMLAS